MALQYACRHENLRRHGSDRRQRGGVPDRGSASTAVVTMLFRPVADCSPIPMANLTFISGRSLPTLFCTTRTMWRTSASTCSACGCSARKSSATSGPRRLLACYFASVITAGLAQLFVPPLLGAPLGPAIGASGGVFGLLLAYAMMFPHRKVVPLIPPIPMPAWLFATLYAAASFFFGVTGTLSGIAHFAHLGGMIGSALVVLQWRRRRARCAALSAVPNGMKPLGYATMKTDPFSRANAARAMVCRVARARRVGAAGHRRHHGHAHHRGALVGGQARRPKAPSMRCSMRCATSTNR
jgi:hypothetical protein